MLLRKGSLTALVVSLLVAIQTAPAQDADKPVYVQGEYLIVARVSGSNQFLAYSKTSGTWRKHTFPDNVMAIPVLGGSVCAFSLSGQSVSELVAVDRHGNWRSHKLPQATASTCVPTVSDALAVYTVDGQAHAFSAELGTWDTIASPEPVAVSTDVATMVTQDRIAAFSAATGKWAVAVTRPARQE